MDKKTKELELLTKLSEPFYVYNNVFDGKHNDKA